MTKNKLLLNFCVGLMKEFHQNKVNKTHPMVLGSALGIFLMIIFLGIGSFVNYHIASPIGTSPDDFNYLPRYSSYFFILCGAILIFNILSFKLALQGKKYSLIEAFLHTFTDKKDIHSKLRKSYSWKFFWNFGKEQPGKEKFLTFLKENSISENDIKNVKAKDNLNYILNNLDNVYYHDFELFLKNLHTDICEQNALAFSLDKCAAFADINENSSEDNTVLKNWIFKSNSIFQITKSTFFMSSSEFMKKLYNLIPYIVLLILSLSFLHMNYEYGNANFETAQLQFILSLEIFCFIGIIYSCFSFYFLRKTEDWREYWNKNGLEFLILFHQRGIIKIPPYIFPDTDYYNPKEYYKIFNACNKLTIKSLYNDNRNMFYDNSQYYFNIIYNQIEQSYNFNMINKSLEIKKHTPYKIKVFDSF